METITNALQAALDGFTGFAASFPLFGVWYTTVIRFVLPVLALLILLTAIRSLIAVRHLPETWAYISLPNGERIPLTHWENIVGRAKTADVVISYAIRSLIAVRHLPETWAYISLPNGERIPLTHWENIVGRAKTADVVISYPSVSRTHAAINRNDRGEWTLYELGSTGGTLVNGRRVDGNAILEDGDVLSFGGVESVFLPVPVEEKRAERKSRAANARPVPPWGSLVLLTLFQVLTAFQHVLAAGAEATVNIPLAFLGLTAMMWIYCLTMRMMRRVGFEMELIAFFLCTLSLSVTASRFPDNVIKNFLLMLLGLFGFVVLCWLLRDLERAQKARWLMAAGAVGLLVMTLIFGSNREGAKLWIEVGGFTFQPSEIAKICYIFAGAATLDRLFRKRNLTLFIVLTAMCGGCLALMNDFGGALIFFVTFIVIAYMRSGDWATLALITSGCGIGGLMLLRLKPHVAARFAVWGHAWEDASGRGYQQVRTMTASASGGLVGVGAFGGTLGRMPQGAGISRCAP